MTRSKWFGSWVCAGLLVAACGEEDSGDSVTAGAGEGGSSGTGQGGAAADDQDDAANDDADSTPEDDSSADDSADDAPADDATPVDDVDSDDAAPTDDTTVDDAPDDDTSDDATPDDDTPVDDGAPDDDVIPTDDTASDDDVVDDAPSGDDDLSSDDDVSNGGAGPGPAPVGGNWLSVVDNQILLPNGEPFHGRGANLNDTRSCDACTYLPPDAEGLNRWSDELLDAWGANFVRFDLMSFTGDNGFRQQWQSLVDDPSYLADIDNTVSHMTSKEGVYVMVTLFADPSIKENNGDYDSEWPTEASNAVYELLAETFAENDKVLFGLTNEPHGPEENNPELAERYLSAIDAIRAVESAAGAPEHIVVVQAPQQWARYLDYFVDNPLPRSNVAYEVHAYNPASDFDAMLRQPKLALPILVGEYGPSNYSSEEDIMALWELCQELEIPHLAWTFHMRCDPSLLQDTADDACGLSPSTGYDFPRTDWGNMLYDYLQTPW